MCRRRPDHRQRLRLRQKARFQQVSWVLLRSHFKRQLTNGWRGYTALVSFAVLCLNVLSTATLKAAYRSGIALPAALVTTALVSLRAHRRAVALAVSVAAAASIVCGRNVADEEVGAQEDGAEA